MKESNWFQLIWASCAILSLSTVDLHQVDVAVAQPLELVEVERQGVADAPAEPNLPLAGGIGEKPVIKPVSGHLHEGVDGLHGLLHGCHPAGEEGHHGSVEANHGGRGSLKAHDCTGR